MAGAAVAMGVQELQQAIEKGGILLVDFWAEWCGPCRAFAPVYQKVAEANPDITFGKVDTEAEEELAAAFQIRSIPTLMVFRERVLLYAQAGALPQAALEQLVSQVRDLDMDKVRADIAAQEKQEKDQPEQQG